MKVLVPAIILTLIISCSGPKYITDFYKDEGMMYFVHPTKFCDDSSECSVYMEPDFTFFYKENEVHPVKINFTIYSKDSLNQVKSVKIAAGEGNGIEPSGLDIMFREKNKERYTCTIEFSDFQQIVNSNQVKFTVVSGNKIISFSETKQWNKLSGQIRANDDFGFMLKNSSN